MKSRRINEKMLLGLSWKERWDSDMREQLHQPMCMFLIFALNEGKVDIVFSFDTGNKVTSGSRRATQSVRPLGFSVSSGASFQLAGHLNLPFASVMKHGRRNALWLKSTSPIPFPCRHTYLNYTHSGSRCGWLNFFSVWARFISCVSACVWNAEQAPLKTTLWF